MDWLHDYIAYCNYPNYGKITVHEMTHFLASMFEAMTFGFDGLANVVRLSMKRGQMRESTSHDSQTGYKTITYEAINTILVDHRVLSSRTFGVGRVYPRPKLKNMFADNMDFRFG